MDVALISLRATDLQDNIAVEAMHDSDERSNAPRCHPETRQAVQGGIHSWITDGDDDTEPKKILLLTGPAGSGKTAIAGSIAESCDDEGILAGSFFFSSFAGSETRRLKRYLITTLVYCLLQHDGLQQLRGYILSAIERDPSIFRKSLSAQCKALILKPLRDAGRWLIRSSLPKVIVIDGLDEVEAVNSRQLEAREARLANEAEQVEILSCLLMAVENPHFPFRILIVSRPEPVIRNFFSNQAYHITREVFLDDKYDGGSDIALFLKAKFTEIRRRYKLALSWPGDRAIQMLQWKASGQFIYAATVIRFLQTSGMHPQARLDCVLGPNPYRVTSDAAVLSPLDALYTQILKTSPNPPLATHWIGAIYCLGSREPALFVRQLLQDYQGQAEYLLETLASLVFIPAVEDERSPFVLYHKSLIDYLHDSKRCVPELCGALQHGYHAFLNSRCAHILRGALPKNHCSRRQRTLTLL